MTLVKKLPNIHAVMARHFIPVGPSLKTSRPTYAKDVAIGDAVLLVDANGAAAARVAAKDLVLSKGVYNPYTKVQLLKTCRYQNDSVSMAPAGEIYGMWGLARHQKYFLCAKQGGKIVVNGVLASAHSSWTLDDIIPASMTHHLPAVYNILFRPLLWLHMLGHPGLVESLVETFTF